MSGFDAFEIGKRRDLGSYTFTAEAIIAFAKKYDPQSFHLDAEAARDSLYGGLCASGWHTTAIWMRKNLEQRDAWTAQLKAEGKTLPVMGPSPGITNLKWLRPVFAGDSVHYFTTVTSKRKRRSNPLWGIVEAHTEGINQNGDKVVCFDNAVLVQL
ncbi:MAG: MaoC family dehydratase [Rhizobiaceae bacterium]|nr:MaoC family dehydratase [Rhizobiaceae bacterium]|tara:strand:+ start:68253 stop:68720 length:468 start_codon:yes stop_codon:yes gene_type:complete